MTEKTDEIAIRKSRPEDIDKIMPVYDSARQFMRSKGILADIAAGNHYIGIDSKGMPAMVFALILGPDPTYDIIEDGAWPHNGPYGTIHRLASTGRHRGILAACTAYALKLADTIRLDTHADNSAMLTAAGRLGYVRCGVIYCQDGTPRIAMQLN